MRPCGCASGGTLCCPPAAHSGCGGHAAVERACCGGTPAAARVSGHQCPPDMWACFLKGCTPFVLCSVFEWQACQSFHHTELQHMMLLYTPQMPPTSAPCQALRHIMTCATFCNESCVSWLLTAAQRPTTGSTGTSSCAFLCTAQRGGGDPWLLCRAGWLPAAIIAASVAARHIQQHGGRGAGSSRFRGGPVSDRRPGGCIHPHFVLNRA